MKRPQPHPPHTGGTFHRRLKPLFTEKRTVSCSGFLPNTSPMQRSCSHHNAFCSMMWLTRMYLRTWPYRWQQSCSYSNAICNHRFKRRIELRTQTQPLVAEHRGGTNSRMKRPQPHPPHTGGTFHRRLQPLYTEKRTVSCSGFLPNPSAMQRSCSHRNVFCSMTWLTYMYVSTHMATPDDNNHAVIPMRSATTRFKRRIELRSHTHTTTRCRTRRRSQFADETTPAAPAAHRRYLSSPAATTLHGKTHGFVLRLPPLHKPHATFMQPSQCILQHEVVPRNITSLCHHFPKPPFP